MKRWPLIRHIRWAIWSMRVERWYADWRHLGYFSTINRKHDDEYLAKIWRGEA